MSKYKIDETNNEVFVSIDDSIILSEGVYTEEELRKEIKKRLKLTARTFRILWKNGKKPITKGIFEEKLSDK